MIDKALESAGGIQKDRQNGQLSFFDKFEDDASFKKTFQEIPNIPEWPESQLLAYEKEMLGLYITKHPLARYEKLLSTYSSCKITELGALRDGAEVLIGGILNKVKITVTRRTQEKMAIATLEDLSGACEMLVFPSTFAKFGSLMKADTIVFVKGKISLREEEPKILSDEVTPLDQVKSRYTKAVAISLVTTRI